ncbi:ALBINO3-like protein 1 [Nymphaea thermarum]|nr:ALBINO3-like protein 1 [Nymphaea thermarum]
MPSLLAPHSLPPVLRPHRPRPSPIRGIPTRRHDSFFRTPRGRNALVVVAKLGFDQFPDSPEDLDAFVRFTQDASSSFERLVGRAEGAIYALSDAAVETVNSVNEKQGGDWLSGITYVLESVLKVLKDGLSALHVPYSYGFAIILLTVLVKAATFPLTKKQMESTLAVRTLQPQIKAIQKRFAGCLPTLATIPVWIGLYRALSNVADEGLLTEGFFWIPSLSGPTTIAARQNGSGISWLFPFVDGHPPLGWSDTVAYLVLPLLLIAAQYISVQLMQPQQVDDPNQRTSQALTKFLPLMIGYFALSVPLTNNILSTAQQVWLLKLGGAKNPVKEFNSKTISPVKEIAEKPAVNSNQVKASVEETKSDSEGLHPGERFKQIKEQEARRRKEREEGATRKAEEAIKAEKMAGSHMDDGVSITSEEKGPKAVVEVNGTGNLVSSDSSALRRSDIPSQRDEV